MRTLHRSPAPLTVLLLLGMLLLTTDGRAQPAWKAHDMNRPRPPVATPPDQALPVPPPPGAVVLFDGTDLSAWEAHVGGPGAWTIENDYMEANRRSGRPAPWTLGDGYFEVTPGTGDIRTRQTFGDVQIHLEWATPTLDRVQDEKGQDRGNSGLFLMGLYEIQILDSYQSETYADGQAAAVYGQYPPLFNACRPPGQWQSYDVLFRRPRFSRTGRLTEPARVTVIHNGIVVQNAVELWGVPLWLQHLPYRPHAARLPLVLQDHGNPVRFRNVWLIELPEAPPPGTPPPDEPAVALAPEVLDRYVGRYGTWTVRREGAHLRMHFFGPLALELTAHSPERFSLKRTAGTVEFDLDAEGIPRSLTFHLGGTAYPAQRVD